MNLDPECNICSLAFNKRRRRPRLLQCNHCFCETCLLAIARHGAGARRCTGVHCPLCRAFTPLPNGRREIRQKLRVETSILEQMEAQGLLDAEEEGEQEQEQEEEEEEPEPEQEAEAGARAEPVGRRRRMKRAFIRGLWNFLELLGGAAEADPYFFINYDIYFH